ncbi:MAG TPA: thioredoxin family protein [Streptosporangiaceae bacterium]
MVTGAIVLGAVLVLATAAGFGWRWRSGRLRESPGARLTEAELGQPLGSRATLVQFSSAFCAPCRATRVLLADVAGKTEGVRHVEIDVTMRLDLVRRLGISRTPTVFVLGPQGQITRRASGLPRRPEVDAALAVVTAGEGGRP